MEQNTLDKIRNRPRFKMFTHLSPVDYADNLKTYLKENAHSFTGNINREVASVSVNNNVHTYWKPYLSLRTEIEDGHTVVRGVFGPSSSVWTFFMFLYFMFSTCWMIFFTIWYVEKQLKSNEFEWSLLLSLLCLALIGLTYLAAKLGAIKAKSEMEELRRFALESTLPHEKIVQV